MLEMAYVLSWIVASALTTMRDYKHENHSMALLFAIFCGLWCMRLGAIIQQRWPA